MYIYAKDVSGSTNNCRFYHELGMTTFEEFQKIVKFDNVKEENVIYLHWNGDCQQVSKDIVYKSYLQLFGSGGTAPEGIINWIKQNSNGPVKLLFIVTDGEIPYGSVARCADLNVDMKYEEVRFHALNQYSIDASVAAPFVRNSNCKLFVNGSLQMKANTSKPYDYDSINLENFFAERELLKTFIKLKFIIKASDQDAVDEIFKLSQLRKRLLKEVSQAEALSCDNSDLKSRNKEILLNALRNTKFYKSLKLSEINSLQHEIDSAVSTLINYINSEKRSFGFDEIKFQSKFNQLVASEDDMEDIPASDSLPEQDKIDFPDIIMYEESKNVPVIMLSHYNLLEKMIFVEHGKTNFSKFSSTMDCPLFLIRDDSLSDSIEYFYTLDVYKTLIESGIDVGPHTRKAVSGGIILQEHFDSYNDFIISKNYFQNKNVKVNFGLFYFVLYKICEKLEWFDRNVLLKFKEYSMRRIEMSECRLGLSSQPLEPTERVPLLTALWFCCELSSCLFMDDEVNFGQEKLRKYFGICRYMIEILEYHCYDLDRELISKRAELFTNVNVLKQIHPPRERKYYILRKIFNEDRHFMIGKFHNSDNIKLLNYLNLDHRKMIPSTYNVNEKIDLLEHIHLSYFKNEEPTELCDKTCRPKFFTVQGTTYYEEYIKIAKEISIDDRCKFTMKPIHKIDFTKVMSYCKLYVNCLIHGRKYPSLDEFLDFFHKKLKFHDGKVRIFPINVISEIDCIYNKYQSLSHMDIDRFISLCKLSVDRVNRIQMEVKDKYCEEEIKCILCDCDKKMVK